MTISPQTLVTTIKNDYAPDFSRVAILGYIDRAQRALMNQDVAQMIWLNGSDDSFPIPFLKTTSGVLEYEINASNLLDSNGETVTLTWGGFPVVPRKIRRVFTAGTPPTTYTRYFHGDAFDWCGFNPYLSARISNKTFYEVPGVIYDRTGLQGCRFQFAGDPGTTTDTYYVEFYVGPVELTSEAVPFSLDADMWEQALIDGAVGYIEDVQNGQSRRLERFLTYWKPRFRMAMQGGLSKRRPLQISIRECG